MPESPKKGDWVYFVSHIGRREITAEVKKLEIGKRDHQWYVIVEFNGKKFYKLVHAVKIVNPPVIEEFAFPTTIDVPTTPLLTYSEN